MAIAVGSWMRRELGSCAQERRNGGTCIREANKLKPLRTKVRAQPLQGRKDLQSGLQKLWHVPQNESKPLGMGGPHLVSGSKGAKGLGLKEIVTTSGTGGKQGGGGRDGTDGAKARASRRIPEFVGESSYAAETWKEEEFLKKRSLNMHSSMGKDSFTEKGRDLFSLS